MADVAGDVSAAKAAIVAMLCESPRPTQSMIASATGLSQGYVAKINKCNFTRVSAGVRRIVEYSRLSPADRSRAAERPSSATVRIVVAAQRLAAHDPLIAEALAAFVERLAEQKSD